MPIQVNCVDCCVELTFPDAMAGRQVQCHVCDAEFVAPGSASPPVAAGRNGGSQPVREERVSATRPARVDREPDVEAVEPVRQPKATRDERVTATRPAKSTAVAAGQTPASDVELVEDDEPIEDVEAAEGPDGEDQPRKKKRKKKRKKARSEFPVWVWWLIAGGVGIVGVFTAMLVLMLGLKQGAAGYVIALLIMMPISMGILVLSMYITSALGGGVDFGDATVAIPKAAALLFVINAINLSPCGIAGYWITLPIWVIGLMGLFRLDAWETFMTVVVNWGLGSVARFVALGILFSAMSHPSSHEPKKPKGPTADDVERIVALGGEFVYGKGADRPVIGIRLRGPSVKDYHLALVTGFPDLQSLDLERSCLTDGGLKQIAEMHQLKEVIVAQTLVSGFGVAKLQQERPDLKVIH